MGKRRAGTLLGVGLPAYSTEPLHRQLYAAIRTAILEGRLRPGTRIPSTRVAADDLGLSRTTVVTAFEQLAAEGYLDARVGSGTRVAHAVPGDLRAPSRSRKRSSGVLAGRLAKRSRIDDVPDLSFLGRVPRPLRPGGGEPALFQTELWSRLAARHWRRVIRSPGHSDSLGYRSLRVAISDYVAKLRAVRCDPDQVLIVGGAQQALYLCAHVLGDPGDSVWMEDPGYPRARWAFRSAGLDVVPVPVDAEGLVVSTGASRSASPRLVYVTPSFQCPLGVMLSLARRFELLALARRCGAWIIEDDYLSEFRAGTRPVASLQSLDQDDRVIYVGNFSKSIVPSLRIGYLVLPAALVETFTRARATMSRQPPGADQAILADFIGEGHLERHVRATQRLYGMRQDAMVEAIRSAAGGLLEASPNGTGMYLVATLGDGRDDRTAARAAAAKGIEAIPLSAFTMAHRHRQGLVLGYAAFDEAVIRRSVAQLAASLAPTRRRG